MADNIEVTPGSGATAAADDIGGVLYPRVKIAQGADGVGVDVSATAPLQVSLANTAANTNKLLVTPDLPTGAATATKQDDAATLLTAIAGLLVSVPVTGAFWQATQPVSAAALPLPTGAATEAKQDTGNTSLASILAKIIAAPATEAKQDTLIAKDFATETTLAAVLAKIIAAPATEAKQDTLIATDFATQTTLAAVLAKIIAAPATEAKQDTQITRATGPTTGTITSVNDTDASATLLAANAARKGATFFNDSTALLYLAMSDVTASATVYSVQVPPGALYELPVGQGGVYTGVVKGIWASDQSGAARVTELT